ncbi:PEGA domain-containing protein [Thermococcus argininiproducens]|uniref:PEGA domain-containing protein n=1 Tax=Thermococcus argininiproducens TaxID=2866384 RepID=A0A9E7SDJ6_9EURY|nr:PEGA domain-containing protein [Thermococcus argininiproducens]USH00103.1 PEGA domain-containing protein [Thermococcus argininiproducens]
MKRLILFLFSMLFFTGNSFAYLGFWWGYTFTRNVSGISGNGSFVVVGINAKCYYESEVNRGMYEVCDGNASVYFFRNGEILWSKEMLGDFILSISYHNTTIALAVQENSTGYVYLIRNDGKILWKKECPWVNNVFVMRRYVIAGDSRGYVYLFNREGRLLWKLKLGDRLFVNGEYMITGSSSNGTVYFIRLIDDNTKMLWEYQTNYVYKVLIGGNSSLVVSFDTYQELYFKKNASILLFSRNGTLFWKRKFRSLVDVEISNNGKYIGVITPSELYFLNMNGKLLWSKNIKDIADVSLFDKSLIVATKRGKIYVFNESGKRDLAFETGKTIRHTIYVDNHVIASGNGFYVFKALSYEPSTLMILAPYGEIHLNGTYIADAPNNITLVPGRYEVRVTRDGCINHVENISLGSGEVKIVKIKGIGYLNVFSNVSNAEVYVNGTSVGIVPLLQYELPEGKYYIEVVAKGYKNYTQEVLVASCEHEVINATLYPLFSKNSEPKIDNTSNVPEMESSISNNLLFLVPLLVVVILIIILMHKR